MIELLSKIPYQYGAVSVYMAINLVVVWVLWRENESRKKETEENRKEIYSISKMIVPKIDEGMDKLKKDIKDQITILVNALNQGKS